MLCDAFVFLLRAQPDVLRAAVVWRRRDATRGEQREQLMRQNVELVSLQRGGGVG